MNQTLLREACERVAEKFYQLAAEAAMARPPQNPLSWEQQVTLYQQFNANPVSLASLKIRQGPEAFSEWVATMKYRSRVLGKIGVNTADMAANEKADVMEAALDIYTAPQGVSNGRA